ncbi:MAG: hypothetical protein SCAL_000008 [Candidatus Syntrophoarchaeum caldarius]|uniref:Uncharacterized protein n=1 Tax=Candidatus Syntropharchaeum caldarium TaxID=1838285 RepID=A0A1F2PBR0_9EURY|nr:MAG: hypothetical protein SCAL_000008 [Candidatus Syntrophoarchaeum caldarius]
MTYVYGGITVTTLVLGCLLVGEFGAVGNGVVAGGVGWKVDR